MRSTRSTDRRRGGEGVFRNLKWSCTHCGKPLKVIDVVLFGKHEQVPCWGSCGCEESKWDGSEIQEHQRVYARAGVPERYIDAECDLQGRNREVGEDGKSLYVHGPYGAGKTYWACALVKALVNMGVSVRYENCGHVMAEIKGMYNGRYSDVLDRTYGCKVLVLDDLGKESATSHSISMLYEIIDRRYAEGKPIVAVSNFSRDVLLERWAPADLATAESIVSRLCDDTEAIYFDGEDRRVS